MSGAAHDIVITGGELIDGTGGARKRADIGIDGGTITRVTSRVLRGRRSIDATDQIVAPGFIDLHSHADFTIESSPLAATQLHQGVTTLVTGNCGLSPFPIADRAQFRAESTLDVGRLSCTWTDGAGFARAISPLGLGVNLALQVGHNAIRLSVMGAADRKPTGPELAKMCDLVRRAARQGVFGVSTGLIYSPGVFATRDEVNSLVRVAAEHGLLYSTHMRNESDHLVDAVREAVSTAERAHARLEISHLKAMGRPNHGSVNSAVELIDNACRRGVDVAMDMYPYCATGTSLVSRLPAWSVAGGTERLLARLANDESRDRIRHELALRFSRNEDPDRIVVSAVSGEKSGAVAGRSIGALARDALVSPAEKALQLLAEHRGEVGIVNHALCEDDVFTVLAHPRASVASDGATLDATGPGHPHPRSFGTFARVLGRYVRERNLLRLEDAVRKMTSLPASRVGLTSRGIVRPGAAADIVVFDPAEVIDRATFENPWQLASGVTSVLVNGTVTLADGCRTGEVGGQVLNRRLETGA